MKKNSPKYHTSQEIDFRREERKHKKKDKHHKHHKHQNLRVFSRVIIEAPSVLSLFSEESYESFILFLTDIRDLILKDEKIRIDFKKTTQIKVCALITLYAHVDFFQRISKNDKIIDITTSNSQHINEALKGIGFWDLVSFQGSNNTNSRLSSITTGCAGQDETAKVSLRKVITFVKDVIFSGNMTKLEQQNLFAAITESVSNVGLHAYPNVVSQDDDYIELVELMGKRWWIVTQKVNNQLFMLIYDLGEGIPCSLVKRSFFSQIVQKFNPKSDSEKIQAAVKYGETRMKSSKHGKGLPDMKNFVLGNPEGQLHIFSGMGQYFFNSKDNNVEIKDHKYSIGGTLVQWNVAIDAGDKIEN